MLDTEKHLSSLINGYRNTTLISAAVKIGIIDGLADAQKKVTELANDISFERSKLLRILRGLVILGVVDEQLDISGPEHIFALTEMGALLRADSNSQFSNFAVLSETQYLPAWLNIAVTPSTEITPFELAFGLPVWRYRQEHSESGAIFDRWLNKESSTVVPEIASALNFHGVRTIADVGGGEGALLAEILRLYPHCSGILSEQSSVISKAHTNFQTMGLHDRCEFVEIDFFESVPSEVNVYLLKSVLHDWGNQDCLKILNILCREMSQASILYIVERIAPEFAIEDADTVWLDLAMLNVTGGQERSIEEFESLIRAAKLSLSEVIRATRSFHILKVTKT